MGDKAESKNIDSLKIGKFKFKDFPKSSAIVMIAKRGSGKSYIVREIIEHFRDIPVGAIICPSEKVEPFYSDFFPSSFIHFNYDPVLLATIFERQIRIKNKYKIHAEKGEYIDPRCIIVMDDCMASKKIWVTDQMIKDVLMNGRHFDMTYILTMQYPLGVTPELRSNFDVIFMLAVDEMKIIRLLHENFAGIFETLDGFRKVLMDITKDYGALVLVKRGATASFWDKVKWYTAKKRNENDVNNVKIGSSQFRKFHEANFNPNWKNDNTLQLDDKSFRNRQKDINIIFKNAKKDKKNIKIDKDDN